MDTAIKLVIVCDLPEPGEIDCPGICACPAYNQLWPESFRLLLYFIVIEKKSVPVNVIAFNIEKSRRNRIYKAVRIMPAVARRHTQYFVTRLKQGGYDDLIRRCP